MRLLRRPHRTLSFAHLQVLDARAAQCSEESIGVCRAGDDRPVRHVAGAQLRGRLGQHPAVRVDLFQRSWTA